MALLLLALFAILIPLTVGQVLSYFESLKHPKQGALVKTKDGKCFIVLSKQYSVWPDGSTGFILEFECMDILNNTKHYMLLEDLEILNESSLSRS
jgi:hypothetical protein